MQHDYLMVKQEASTRPSSDLRARFLIQPPNSLDQYQHFLDIGINLYSPSCPVCFLESLSSSGSSSALTTTSQPPRYLLFNSSSRWQNRFEGTKDIHTESVPEGLKTPPLCIPEFSWHVVKVLTGSSPKMGVPNIARSKFVKEAVDSDTVFSSSL